MTTTVSFPGLGLEFELDRVAFSIGGFSVYWYGLLIGIGFLLAGAYAVANSRKVGVDGDRLIDVILTGLVCGIIGARLYYVAFSWEMFRDNPMNIFNIRMGGLAIYGGIIAGVLGGAVMARIRRCPVTGYQLVALLPLVPGGGIYYAMSYCLEGDTERFLTTLLDTLGTAAALAVGVILASSLFRAVFFHLARSRKMTDPGGQRPA